jgi:rubrerythrin
MAKKKEKQVVFEFECENCGFTGEVDEQTGKPMCPVCHYPAE